MRVDRVLRRRGRVLCGRARSRSSVYHAAVVRPAHRRMRRAARTPRRSHRRGRRERRRAPRAPSKTRAPRPRDALRAARATRVAEARGALRPADLSRAGFVRYDAFAGSGAGLSYALALLNRQGDGVVLTSIYSREDTRTYRQARCRIQADRRRPRPRSWRRSSGLAHARIVERRAAVNLIALRPSQSVLY